MLLEKLEQHQYDVCVCNKYVYMILRIHPPARTSSIFGKNLSTSSERPFMVNFWKALVSPVDLEAENADVYDELLLVLQRLLPVPISALRQAAWVSTSFNPWGSLPSNHLFRWCLKVPKLAHFKSKCCWATFSIGSDVFLFAFTFTNPWSQTPCYSVLSPHLKNVCVYTRAHKE